MDYYNNIYNISLQQIQIFLKCYEYRKFVQVAEEYNFTPSMVSKTIKQLEKLLGFQLFIRQHHVRFSPYTLSYYNPNAR